MTVACGQLFQNSWSSATNQFGPLESTDRMPGRRSPRGSASLPYCIPQEPQYSSRAYVRGVCRASVA